jgi:hypothetical protein
MRPWQIEWVARWQIGSKPRKVAEEAASGSYCQLKLPEIKPAKNVKSNKNNKKSTEIRTIIIT